MTWCAWLAPCSATASVCCGPTTTRPHSLPAGAWAWAGGGRARARRDARCACPGACVTSSPTRAVDPHSPHRDTQQCRSTACSSTSTRSTTHTHTHTQPFNGLWSGTTRVGRYQKKHSPTHTHPDHRTSFIILHLQRSMASSLFILRA